MSDSFKFDEDVKKVREFTERLPFGISEVTIEKFDEGKTDQGKHFIEATVKTSEGVEDKVRLWLTTTVSANISFNTLRDIAVHDAKTETDKEKRRKAIDNTSDSSELVALMQQLKSPQAWVTKYYDKERTYTDSEGKVRRSINTNIMGYQPKLKPELMPSEGVNEGVADALGTDEITKDNISDIPF